MDIYSGLTEYDCEVQKQDACEHYKMYEYDENDQWTGEMKCVYECPEGYWIRTFSPYAGLEFKVCEKCPDGCKVRYFR